MIRKHLFLGVIVVVFLSLVVSTHAEFSVQLGVGNANTPNGIETSKVDKSVYLVAEMRSLGDNTNMIGLIKYSDTGTLQWSKTYGSTGSDGGNDITIDSNHDIIVTGRAAGNMEGQTNLGGNDVVVSKFKPDGTMVWTRLFGTSSDDVGQGVAVDPSTNDIYVAGTTSGSFGGTNAGMKDIFLMKLNSSGNAVWIKQQGSATTDEGKAIVFQNNKIFVFGQSDSSVNGATHNNDYDVVAIAFDTSGSVLWTFMIGSSGTDRSYGAAGDNQGGILVAGGCFGAITGATQVGGQDMFTIRLWENGTLAWVSQFGSTQQDFGSDVTVYNDRVYVIGTISQLGFFGQASKGGFDIAVAELALSTGTPIQGRVYGSAGADLGISITTNVDGTPFAAGNVKDFVVENVGTGSNSDILLSEIYFDQCQPGTYRGDIYSLPTSAEVGKICPPCPVNSFSNVTNATVCSICPSSLSNLAPGSTSCNSTGGILFNVDPPLGPMAGKTNISITGTLMEASTQPFFELGNVIVNATNCVVVTSSRINCTTPVFPVEGQYSLSRNSVVPFVRPKFTVFSANWTALSSGSGFDQGGKTITITGKSLTLNGLTSQAQCKFDHAVETILQPAQVTSASSVTCVTPQMNPGQQNISVGLNGQQFDPVAESFLAYDASINNILPRTGPKTGNTTVTLTLTGTVDPNTQPRIQIQPQVQGAVREFTGKYVAFTPSVRINATTPSFPDLNIATGNLRAGTTFVAPDGAINLPTTQSFSLYNEHGLSGVTPVSAPTNPIGSVVVSLAPDGGKGFANTNEIRVVFRDGNNVDHNVPGNHQSASVVTATLPTINTPGSIQVAVALNGQQFSPWISMTLFSVDSIWPRWGPTSGGTKITIVGKGFGGPGVQTNQVKCRFTNTVRTATIVSSTHMTCDSPVFANSTVSLVTVTTNGIHYNSINNVTLFRFEASVMPTVTGVSPLQVPAQFSTSLQVIGTDFVDTGNIMIRFGATEVQGTFVNSTHLSCTLPALAASQYAVTVSLNGGQQYTPTNNAINLLSVSPTLTSISPLSGPVSGATQMTIVGSGFLTFGNNIRVRFGQVAYSFANVNASSSSRITLTTPTLMASLPQSFSTTNLPVAISTNNANSFHTGNLQYQVFANQIINFNRTEPSFVINTGGGAVTVFGTIPDVQTTSFVRLNDAKGWVSAPLPCIRTLTTIRFNSPVYRDTLPATFNVQVALNGQQFFDTQLKIEPFLAPIISSVNPTTKDPSQTLVITIIGSNFKDTGNVKIRLGQRLFTPEAVTSTAITFVSTSNHEIGEYRIDVSLDGGQHWSESDANTRYTIIQASITCPSNTNSLSRPLTPQDCFCKEGFYTKLAVYGVPCEPCPTNGDCAGGLSQPVAKKGYYPTGTGNSLQYSRCAVFEACPGGNTSTVCTTGYQDFLCGTCQPGFFKLGEACRPCQEGSGGSTVIGILAFIVFLFWIKRQARMAHKNAPSVLALAITHLQVISTFAEYRLDWSKDVSDSLNLFSITNVNLDIGAPECSVSDWTFETRFWMTVCLPLVVFLGIVIRVIGQFIRSQWVLANGAAFQANHPGFCSPPDATFPKWKFVLHLIRYQFSTLFTQSELVDQDTFRFALNEFLFSLGLLYITLCNSVLAVFDCTELRPGFSVMDVDPTAQCWVDGGLHARLIIPASVFLLLYVFGIPLAFVLIMMSGRDVHKRSEPAFQNKFGTLFSKFSETYYWYEGLVLLRKALVVAIKLFLTELPALQGLVALLVLGAASLMQSHFKPYKMPTQNRLESILLIIIDLLLIAGIVFASKSGVTAVTSPFWNAFCLAIIIAVVVVVLLFVINDIVQIINEARNAQKRSADKIAAIESFDDSFSNFVLPAFRFKMISALDANFSIPQIKAMSTLTNKVIKERYEHGHVQGSDFLSAASQCLKEKKSADLIAFLTNSESQSEETANMQHLITKMSDQTKNDNSKPVVDPSEVSMQEIGTKK